MPAECPTSGSSRAFRTDPAPTCRGSRHARLRLTTALGEGREPAESRHGREAAGLSAATDAEVGGDDRGRRVAVDAGSARRVDGGEPDVAPARVEQVLAVRRAVEPELHRTRRADAGRAP